MKARALIGRDRDQAWQAALQARDVETLFVPLLTIDPVAAPGLPARLARARAVLLTSANAMPALRDAARDLAILAVGDATAQAARDAGFVAVDSADGDVAALAQAVRRRFDPRSDTGGGPLLYLRGADVAADLGALLPEFGIEQAVVYRATPVAEIPAAARRHLAQGAVDLVLLFSPRSAAGFVSLIEDAGLAEHCSDMTLVAFSPAVARAAERLPWAKTLISVHPTRAMMLAAIDAALQTKGKA